MAGDVPAAVHTPTARRMAGDVPTAARTATARRMAGYSVADQRKANELSVEAWLLCSGELVTGLPVRRADVCQVSVIWYLVSDGLLLNKQQNE